MRRDSGGGAMRGGLSLAIAISALAGSAYAQPNPQSERAEKAYQEARTLVQQNRWEEGCVKFEESLRYEVATGTQLNLAHCYEHIGKLASAWKLYVQVQAAEASAGQVAQSSSAQQQAAARSNYAQQHAVALEPRVPKLAVVAPTHRPTGLAVTEDDAPIQADGSILRVNPGAHRVLASAPGYEPFTRVVWLNEGASETVVIPDLAVRAAPVSRWTPRR